MATHDYVIANGTGAAVRSDLNNALAAIVSNNSGSTEPGTTYAYQWWADTTANVLKIRNSANNAWITLRELDGTMLIENGSASAPGLAFASDVDTGIFRSDSNKLNFATNGVERLELANTTTTFNEGGNDINLRVETSGSANMLFIDGGENRVGMGTDAPDDILHIKKGGDSIVRIENVGNGNASGIFFVRENSSGTAKGAANIHVLSDTSGTGTELIVGCGSNTSATGGERLRLTSNGKLLINHSASRSVGAQRIVQIEGTSDATAGISILRNTNDSSSPTINLGKSRGTSNGSNTIVQDDDGLGSIYFRAADGTDINSIAASIDVQVDGTPGSNDTPGRIIFGTTADGASSPTERVRIDSSGNVGISTTTTSGANLVIATNSNGGSGIKLIGKSANGGAEIDFRNNADSTLNGFIEFNDNGGILSTVVNQPQVFRTNNTERMRIDSSGRLLVGTTSQLLSGDEKKLQITHANAGAEIILGRDDTAVTAGNSLGAIKFVGNEGGTYHQVAKIEAEADLSHSTNDKPGRLVFSTTADGASSPTEALRIDSAQRLISLPTYNATSGSSGNVGISSGGKFYRSTSSGKYKTNVETIQDSYADALLECRPVWYRSLCADDNPEHGYWGFIAEEVAEIDPRLVFWKTTEVTYNEDGSVVESPCDPETEGVAYDRFIPHLLNLIKRQQQAIETLETKVAALEAG